MRIVKFSINVTLDGCCDHRVMFADEELHRHAMKSIQEADALVFGRVTYGGSTGMRSSFAALFAVAMRYERGR